MPFQQSDLAFFERVLQLAVQLYIYGLLLLDFLLFLHHSRVEIADFHTLTLNRTLYVVQYTQHQVGAVNTESNKTRLSTNRPPANAYIS